MWKVPALVVLDEVWDEKRKHTRSDNVVAAVAVSPVPVVV